MRADLLILLGVGWLEPSHPAQSATTPLPYRDATQPMERRIEDLLARMTLEEKVGQMNMPCICESGLGEGIIEKTTAREARAIGVHEIFTLVIEPIRDPRLGRNEEAFSEDPYLCSRIAETIVRSAQGINVAGEDKVVAGLCHYPGQSQPVSGFERGAMEISERLLREVFLPSWQAGIQRCRALGVMATYPAIYDVNLKRVVEPGPYRLMAGASSEELPLSGNFSVTGP